MTAARKCGNSLGTAMSGTEVRRVLGNDESQINRALVIFTDISQPLMTCHKGMQLAGQTQAVAFTGSLEVEG